MMILDRPGPYIVGIRAIAARLGISELQVHRLRRQAHFLMFQVPNFAIHPGTHNKRIGNKLIWITSEPLVHKWELMQCQKQFEKDRGQKPMNWGGERGGLSSEGEQKLRRAHEEVS